MFHVGGALSLADILAVLYSKGFIRYNEDPSWDERGRFILSKGHACLAYYSVLRVLNYINDEDLQKFETDVSNPSWTSNFKQKRY